MSEYPEFVTVEPVRIAKFEDVPRFMVSVANAILDQRASMAIPKN